MRTGRVWDCLSLITCPLLFWPPRSSSQRCKHSRHKLKTVPACVLWLKTFLSNYHLGYSRQCIGQLIHCGALEGGGRRVNQRCHWIVPYWGDYSYTGNKILDHTLTNIHKLMCLPDTRGTHFDAIQTKLFWGTHRCVSVDVFMHTYKYRCK